MNCYRRSDSLNIYFPSISFVCEQTKLIFLKHFLYEQNYILIFKRRKLIKKIFIILTELSNKPAVHYDQAMRQLEWILHLPYWSRDLVTT